MFEYYHGKFVMRIKDSIVLTFSIDYYQAVTIKCYIYLFAEV